MIKNVEEIRKTPVEDVLKNFVELKPKGGKFFALCPFHQEKTPSFVVDPGRNNYHCFGCGESGDGVSFLMEHQGLTYPEALEEAARIGQVRVEYENHINRNEFIQQSKEQQDRKKILFQTLAEITQAYIDHTFHPSINWTQDQIECAGRIYRFATLQKFKICYAPGFEKKNFIKDGKRWSNEVLLELGVLKSSNKGGVYDFFRDRLLFPILDHQGRVVGFGGRKPKDDKRLNIPKYLNSPESLAYQKGKVLYGLYQNKKGIRKKGALLVEGYTDVCSLYEFGIDNAVASCGTALTDDQAKLLKRYTNKVTILRDGDSAGIVAAMKDVEILVKAGLNVKVCLLDQGHDPDSFIRKHKKKGFEIFLEKKTQDGLIWRVMEEWDEEDNFLQNEALNLAGELLAYIQEKSLRQTYIKDLCHKSRMGSVKITLKEKIEQYRKKHLKNGSKLSRDQEVDVINYGFYEKNNCYFICSNPEGLGYSVSNFVIHPIMLVIGASESQRIVEIKNRFNKSFILNLPSDALTKLNIFRSETERMGNFRFTGKIEHYEKIKGKVYQDSKDCFPINVMGLHREGFYSWGNGISYEGKFHQVDEYGVVEFKQVKYFLPAFSNIQDKIKGDDMDEEFEFEKKFRFFPEGNCTSFTEWTKSMAEVHRDNGKMGVAFYCAALFRDILFNKFGFFPHLNLFGPSGAGKTFLARSLMALFGQGNKHDPFNLASGTIVAFKRRLAQVSNGIIFFDEYSNDVEFRRVEALKGSYDGAGHEKGIASQDNRTKTTKVKSASIIAGQQQPTQDIALFKRVISLNFSSGKNTLQGQQAASRLKEIEASGQLTQITQFLIQYRDIIEERFSQEYETLRSIFNRTLTDNGHFVEDRIINNHLIPLAAVNVLSSKIDFGFDIGEFGEFVMNNIINQSESIFSEDELSIFWRILEHLHDKHIIHDKKDILVPDRKTENYQNEMDRADRKDSLNKVYEPSKRLLYLRFANIHPEYQERHQRQRGKNGLDLQALQYYLKQHPAYEGQKRAKKFDVGKSYSCFVFDLDQLPIELPLTFGGGRGDEES